VASILTALSTITRLATTTVIRATASTSARLADVVRCFGLNSTQYMAINISQSIIGAGMMTVFLGLLLFISHNFLK
jgi:hypothetical protein